jgi:hypothetical protein
MYVHNNSVGVKRFCVLDTLQWRQRDVSSSRGLLRRVIAIYCFSQSMDLFLRKNVIMYME